MNGKKPSKFQFHFPGLLKACSLLKKTFKKSANLDFGDNPIYPISNPDGQDQKKKKLNFYIYICVYPSLLNGFMVIFPLEADKILKALGSRIEI